MNKGAISHNQNAYESKLALSRLALLQGHFGERRDFGFLLTQRGMFSYTGITALQVNRLRKEHGVYLIHSGRMCMSGLSRDNVQYVADAIANVLEGA